jgi:hypothetical protein
MEETMGSESLRESVDLFWRVDASHDSQLVMLQLEHLEIRYSDILSDRQIMAMFLALNGASFSLWRAPFLITPGFRTFKEACLDARRLRLRILETNSVNFMVDQSTRDWMSGYYLKNAKYRLDEVLEGLRGYWNEAKWSPTFDQDAREHFEDLTKRLGNSGEFRQSWSNVLEHLKNGHVTVPKAFDQINAKEMIVDVPPTDLWRTLRETMCVLTTYLLAIAVLEKRNRVHVPTRPRPARAQLKKKRSVKPA